MSDTAPNVVVIGGPNGSGKSTAAPALLRDYLGITEFVNADVIAQGLSGFGSQNLALHAGRIMLDRLKELAARKADFAFETTLASRTFAPWLVELKRSGYRRTCCFFGCHLRKWRSLVWLVEFNAVGIMFRRTWSVAAMMQDSRTSLACIARSWMPGGCSITQEVRVTN